MKIVCSGCGAQHWLSDMQLADGGCNIVCPRCSTSIYADASMVDPQSLEPRWYYASENDSVGPISTRDLEFALQNGQITLDSYVWCDGMADWMALGTIADFEYLRSMVQGESSVGDNDETRVASVASVGVSEPVPSFGDFVEDDLHTTLGDETAAIDMSEYEQNGGMEALNAASAAAAGGAAAPADDDPIFDMNESEPNANDMVSGPNESSVLFSLSSLQAVAPAPVSDLPSSNANMLGMGPTAPAVSRRRSNEIVDSFGGSSMPMATVLPLGTKKDNTPLIIGIIAAAVIIIGLIVGVAVVLSNNKTEAPVQASNLDAGEVAANDLGIAPTGAIAEAEAKAKAEEEAAKKAEEEAAAKAAEEEAAKKAAEEEAAEEEAAKKAEEEAAKKAEEEAAAEEQKKAETKKAETKKKETKAPEKKPETKTPEKKPETKTPEKKPETKKTETKPAAASSLSKADIQAAFRAASGDIRACSRTSTTKGQMKISFTIKADGKVSGAKVTSPEFAGTPTATCVLKVVNGIKFKAPGSDTPISNYPIAIQ